MVRFQAFRNYAHAWNLIQFNLAHGLHGQTNGIRIWKLFTDYTKV